LITTNVLSQVVHLFWDWRFRYKRNYLTGGVGDWLYFRRDRFMDFIHTVRSSDLEQIYSAKENVVTNYPPFIYLLLKPIGFLRGLRDDQILINTEFSEFNYDTGQMQTFGTTPADSFTATIWLLITIACIVVSTKMIASFLVNLESFQFIKTTKQLVVITYLLTFSVLVSSYPLVFAVDRGNLELLTFTLVLVYLLLNNKGNNLLVKRIKYFCLAIAVSIKPYVLVFVLIDNYTENGAHLIKGSAYKLLKSRLLWVVSLVLLINTIALSINYDGDIIRGLIDMREAQSNFFSSYVVSGEGNKFTVSPWNQILFLFDKFRWDGDSTQRLLAIKSYQLFLGIYCFVIINSIFKIRTNKLRQILLLIALPCLILVFPYGANEYKAIYLLIPFLICGFIGSDLLLRISMPSQKIQNHIHFIQTSSLALPFPILINKYQLLADFRLSSALSTISILFYVFLLPNIIKKAAITDLSL